MVLTLRRFRSNCGALQLLPISHTYMIKIAGAFEMLFASFANILLPQMIEILLRPRNPGHSLSIIAALA